MMNIDRIAGNGNGIVETAARKYVIGRKDISRL